MSPLISDKRLSWASNRLVTHQGPEELPVKSAKLAFSLVLASFDLDNGNMAASLSLAHACL